MVDCKSFIQQLLSCGWEAVKVEEKEAGKSFRVTPLIAVDVILSVSWESRGSEPLLKWYGKCAQCTLHRNCSSKISRICYYLQHLCVLGWRKKRRMSSSTTPHLFLISLLVFPPTQWKVRGEASNTKLSSSAQHTVHTIELVTRWAFSTIHFSNIHVHV